MANNNYPQITSVTSEALQSQIRTLLPSQEGFGTDLMAQNVIVPIIDLTSAAEGSSVPQNLQTALAFGSQTPFAIANATLTTIISTSGFHRVFGVANATGSGVMNLTLDDGTSIKNIYLIVSAGQMVENFDFVVFLRAGDSLKATASTAACRLDGSTRQIADVNGVLVNPVGFNPQ